MADPTIHDLYVALGGDPDDTDPTMQDILEAVTALAAGGGGINWRGAWLIGTAYSQGDGASRAGVAYLALADNTGSQPPSANWQALVVVGPAGPQGDEGPEGPAGGGSSFPLTAAVSAAGFPIQNLPDPVEDGDAVPKAYVDGLGGTGFDYNQIEDPGAVGAGKTWFRRTRAGSPPTADGLPDGGGLLVRNDANDGWLTAGSLAIGDDFLFMSVADLFGVTSAIVSRTSDLTPVYMYLSVEGKIVIQTDASGGGRRTIQIAGNRINVDGGSLGPSGTNILVGEADDEGNLQSIQIVGGGSGWTGGAFTVTDGYGGYDTESDPIPFDATAQEVEDILNAWAGFEAWACSGGPFPGSPITAVFNNTGTGSPPDGVNVYLTVVTNTLTGDTPTVVFTRSTGSTGSASGDGSILMASTGPYGRVDGEWVPMAARAAHVADGATVDDLRDAMVDAGLMAPA